MARDNYLHFRVDNQLLEAIDAVAATTPDNNRSQVCRLLLQQALGNDIGVEAVKQALYETSGLRKKVSRRLAKEMNTLFPQIVDEVLSEGG